MTTSIFSGLSAFPITPADEMGIDRQAYTGLLARLVDADVDSIGVLGTTGNYPYFTATERADVISLAVQTAGDTPVIAGIGALRTKDVLHNADLAQQAGASGVLFSPMSYQPLTEDEVFDLYQEVAAHISVPICLYDNPITTKFTFTDDLYGAIAQLKNVEAVKVPGVPTDLPGATRREAELRQVLPENTKIGVSGDASAAAGLSAGFDVWFSVLGGLLPRLCRELTHAAEHGPSQTALDLSNQLAPLWDLNTRYGSLRVTSAIAAQMKLTQTTNLPKPLQPLPASAWPTVRQLASQLEDHLDLAV